MDLSSYREPIYRKQDNRPEPSQVRFIDPSTGEHIAEPKQPSKLTVVAHYISNNRRSEHPAIKKIMRQVAIHGYTSLSKEQVEKAHRLILELYKKRREA